MANTEFTHKGAALAPWLTTRWLKIWWLTSGPWVVTGQSEGTWQKPGLSAAISLLGPIPKHLALSTFPRNYPQGITPDLRLFLQKLVYEQPGPLPVFEGSISATALAHGKRQSKRVKHYQPRTEFLNGQYKREFLSYLISGTKRSRIQKLPRKERALSCFAAPNAIPCLV